MQNLSSTHAQKKASGVMGAVVVMDDDGPLACELKAPQAMAMYVFVAKMSKVMKPCQTL